MMASAMGGPSSSCQRPAAEPCLASAAWMPMSCSTAAASTTLGSPPSLFMSSWALANTASA